MSPSDVCGANFCGHRRDHHPYVLGEHLHQFAEPEDQCEARFALWHGARCDLLDGHEGKHSVDGNVWDEISPAAALGRLRLAAEHADVEPHLRTKAERAELLPLLEALADRLCQTVPFIIGSLTDVGLTVVPLDPSAREVSPTASKLGRLRMAKLTPKEKSALGKLGAAKRWAKNNQK